MKKLTGIYKLKISLKRVKSSAKIFSIQGGFRNLYSTTSILNFDEILLLFFTLYIWSAGGLPIRVGVRSCSLPPAFLFPSLFKSNYK
jgi:hypothetical protein